MGPAGSDKETGWGIRNKEWKGGRNDGRREEMKKGGKEGRRE